MSKDIITKEILTYNQKNKRDIYIQKPKNITRYEYIQNLSKNTSNQKIFEKNYIIYDYKRQRNKNNNTYSEILEYFNPNNLVIKNSMFMDIKEDATHIHHIFPIKYFPEFSCYYENIIALTPTQHYNYAHIKGNTKRINEGYFLYILLVSKIELIKKEQFYCNKNIFKNNYSFEKFINMINKGLKLDTINATIFIDYINKINKGINNINKDSYNYLINKLKYIFNMNIIKLK